MKMAQKSPIIHARKVSAGISMSSVLETAARTSGYGDSSSHSVKTRWERMMCVVVRSGEPGITGGGDTIRTCSRLGTGVDVRVEEDDAIFVEAILELEGHDSIV